MFFPAYYFLFVSGMRRSTPKCTTGSCERTLGSIFKEHRLNKYRRNFLLQRVCGCWNKPPSIVVGAGTLNEFKSRLKAHFVISPLLYDHWATWDSRKGLGAGSPHVGAVGSYSA